jgi:hypothetical protein
MRTELENLVDGVVTVACDGIKFVGECKFFDGYFTVVGFPFKYDDIFIASSSVIDVQYDLTVDFFSKHVWWSSYYHGDTRIEGGLFADGDTLYVNYESQRFSFKLDDIVEIDERTGFIIKNWYVDDPLMHLTELPTVALIGTNLGSMGKLSYSPYDDYFYLYVDGKDHFFSYKFKREDIDRIDDYSIRLRR